MAAHSLVSKGAVVVVSNSSRLFLGDDIPKVDQTWSSLEWMLGRISTGQSALSPATDDDSALFCEVSTLECVSSRSDFMRASERVLGGESFCTRGHRKLSDWLRHH